jgi:hypothetical protein
VFVSNADSDGTTKQILWIYDILTDSLANCTKEKCGKVFNAETKLRTESGHVRRSSGSM